MTPNKNILELIEKNFKPSSNTLKKHFYTLINHEYTRLSLSSNPNFEHFINTIKNTINLYYTHQSLLKSFTKLPNKNELYFDILKTKPEDNVLEKINDQIMKIYEHSVNKKYAKSFLRSYHTLIDEETIKLFGIIHKKKFEREIITKSLSKVAAMKNSADLNTALLKIIKTNELSIDSILEKIKLENLDVGIISSDENKLIVQINDYSASQSLGSSQWCISYDIDMYYEYLSKMSDDFWESDLEDVLLEGNHFFVWDFNKGENSETFQFAYTISCNGDIIAAHDINDNHILHIDGDNDLFSLLNDNHINLSIRSVITDTFESSLIYSKKDNRDTNTLYSKPIDFVINSVYPLHIYRKVAEKTPLITDEIEDLIQLPEILFKKTIQDHESFKLISDEQLLDDFLWSAALCDELNDISDAIENDINNPYGSSMNNHPDFDIHYNSGEDLLLMSEIFEVTKDIPHNNKHLIIKKHLDVFENVKISIMRHLDCNRFSPYENIAKSNDIPFVFYNNQSEIINLITDHIDLFNLTNKEKITFSLSKTLIGDKCEVNEKNDNYVINQIELGNIHINKLLINVQNLSESFSFKLAHTINQNPGLILLDDGCINSSTLLHLSKNYKLTSTLNKTACNTLKLFIRNNLSGFGLISSKDQKGNLFFPEHDLGQHVNFLYKKGLIDKNIIKSSLKLSNLSIEDQENYPHDKVSSLLDYILLNKKDINKIKVKN